MQRSQRTGENYANDLTCSGCAKGLGDFAHRRAGGHDVVEDDPIAVDPIARNESARQCRTSLLGGEPSLLRPRRRPLRKRMTDLDVQSSDAVPQRRQRGIPPALAQCVPGGRRSRPPPSAMLISEFCEPRSGAPSQITKLRWIVPALARPNRVRNRALVLPQRVDALKRRRFVQTAHALDITRHVVSGPRAARTLRAAHLEDSVFARFAALVPLCLQQERPAPEAARRKQHIEQSIEHNDLPGRRNLVPLPQTSTLTPSRRCGA